jgi:hypothetical protein
MKEYTIAIIAHSQAKDFLLASRYGIIAVFM